ncbi:response regulator transcription factor [Tenacibaculum maritimum]|uniref:Two-component system response regulatory protein n=3 Tax=Tenacibaculum maritimum TaxID=107401 RepID=A0A2H1EA44_9FLAO|nr:response regulator [Tenacibaculum maritimum]MCD9563352.1 response regulator [Tenacibaculum maritimum]MCD9566247.1 response regulator [Tenacibaculum maritimum]MCD9578725.1 response regulator [Tenacibaculum maritimum]MCD9584542.1 response regulator [Tenacibaculum maritimum]MCD9596826.1 response regulator [Tenacibaculum maritimum]
MRKILIVDDEPNIVMTLEYALKKRGFKVYIARDGEEALQLIKDDIPDLMLLDVMMPNVDGYQTIQYIKREERFKNIKVVFLSAKNKEVDIKKGLELGADKYLIKPFSIKKIVLEIEMLLY